MSLNHPPLRRVVILFSLTLTFIFACTTYELDIEAPEESRIDEEIEIVIAAAEPGEEVEITAETADAYGNRWISQAKFTADRDGKVKLAEAEPVSGSYGDADAMGLFWSMEPDENAERVIGYDPPLEGMDVVFTAQTESDRQGRETLSRHFHSEGVDVEWISEDGLVGEYFSPDTDEPLPGAIMLHGRPAGFMVIQSMALASNGYRVFAPMYYQPEHAEELERQFEGITDLPEALEERPVEYVQDAIDWLRARPEVAESPVGVGGASAGGELALIAAAHLDGIGAIVSWHGRLALSGSRGKSAWSFDGEPLPYLSATRKNVIESTVEAAVVGEDSPEPADMWDAIEPMVDDDIVPRVENSRAPVLLISGTDDAVHNATAFQEGVAQRLERIEYDEPFEHLAYQGAGHWFDVPYLPSYIDMGPGGARSRTADGSPEVDAATGADSWPCALEYFRMESQKE